MSNRLALFLALNLLFFISSCKKQTIPVASSTPTPPSSKVGARNLEFDYFSARGKIQVDGGKEKVSSAMSMRIRRDSVIWISVVPALGIEVARMRITQDSVHMINRLQKYYFAGDYSFLKQQFKVDVNYNMLQAIILGNYIAGTPGQETVVSENPQPHIQQRQNNLILNQFLDVTTSKLQKVTIQDEASKNNLTATYSQFNQVMNKPFAKTVSITVQQGGTTTNTGAVIEYSKVGIDEGKLSFPFAIPEGYTRK
ncbi:DUF4292 domain-containing protein [Adhaeribacter aquaticus]|uniref:DUF4292 domain-containing protein n=1 Tax=Adhaeribacter aquaticus TaxID=299567 RepID=UPI000407242E|nr:DUF4292 domain-containing protein [Adhaeribacter aquaticus]